MTKNGATKQKPFITTFLLIGYALVFAALVVYSYSQIALNLTLSSNPVYQQLQEQLIQLGYFNRPTSTLIFLGLLAMLFGLYAATLWLVHKKYVGKKHLIWLVAVSGVLIIAYPAFSADIFNYIFDARILVTHGDNPYFHKALDYPFDLWIRFMRWTHRTYPYGPWWLMVTVPFYVVGFGKFTLTLAAFKLLFAWAHLGNTYLVYGIAHKIRPRQALFATAFYALNPLVLIESIVSPHLDSVMLLFLLLGIWFFLYGQKTRSIILVLLSAAVKFVTAALLPLFMLLQPRNIDKLLVWGTWGFLAATLVPIYFREPFPWYFIPALGLAALTGSVYTYVFTVAISAGTLLRYSPFLFFGDYGPMTKTIQLWVTIIPLILAMAIISLLYAQRQRKKVG